MPSSDSMASSKQDTYLISRSGSSTEYETLELKSVLDQRFFSDISEQDLQLACNIVTTYSIVDAVQVIEKAILEHRDDPAVRHEFIDHMEELLLKCQHQLDKNDDGAITELKLHAFIIHEWSIYPEVRSCTRPIDESDEHQETWRVYALGILWSCSGSVLATFFANRFPSISLGSSALQILIVFTGRLLSLLPNWAVKIGGKKILELNPGKWTFKEQMLTTLTMSVSVGSPYSLNAIVAQSSSEFYGIQGARVGYMLLLTFSSQFMGFGIAGLMRTFLVYPTKCVWYSVLPTITLNRSLVGPESCEAAASINGWRLSRFKVFAIFAFASFAWYWVTNFLFQSLGYFDWMAWIKPQNVNLQAITGCLSGLALNPISTFDWNIIDQGGMVAPLFATVNQFVGVVISTVAILIIWYTNVRFTSFLPINSNVLFANDGKKFKVSKVLDSKGLLDITSLRKYSLPFYSAGNLINYGVNFMVYPAMFVYAALNYKKTIWCSLKEFGAGFHSRGRGLALHNDRFSRAQKKYPEVSEVWFLFILVVSLGAAVATVKYYEFTNTPVWTLFFGVGLATIFTIPFGILYSRTNCSLDINVLFEIIIGYAMPGNGMGLMVSKVYATNFMAQADNYITNQVQAHYTGIAPRSLFRLQILSVICNTFVQTGIIYWQLNGGIPNLCDIENTEKFTCQGVRTYFNASVIWGVIGPQRIFDHVYPGIKWCFLIGAIYPLVFYVARRFIKKLDKVNEMVVLTGAMCWSPTNWMYLLPNLYIAGLFNGHIKDRYPRWWTKYNYILNAALKVGIAYAGLIVFFSTEYKQKVVLHWWGNTVSWNTMDALNTAVRRTIPSSGYFGPDMSSLNLT